MQVFDIDLKTEFSALKKMSGGILRCYIPEVSSEADPDTQRPSVLIYPGGAYVFCSNREAEPIALYYLSKGYNAFVLFYSVAPAKYPEPQVQAMAAIELIRCCMPRRFANTAYRLKCIYFRTACTGLRDVTALPLYKAQ